MSARAVVVLIALMLAGCGGDDEPVKPTPLQREILNLPGSLEEIHPDLFHDVSRAEFRAAARRLADVAPRLTKDELVVGVMRLAELAGGAPSQWGDPTSFELNRVGLTVQVATLFHDFGPADAVRPDLLVEPTAADFFLGRDPVLEEALALR